MRFDIGDKVRIKDYEDIRSDYPCMYENKETLNNEVNKVDRVVTIENIVYYQGYTAYKFVEVDGSWFDWLVDCSFEECKLRYYIKSRFEILDL